MPQRGAGQCPHNNIARLLDEPTASNLDLGQLPDNSARRLLDLILIKATPITTARFARGTLTGRSAMAKAKATKAGSESVKIPFMQRVLDNPFLLLFLGVVFPTVFYILWGVIELTQIPVAK
jgi:hypothetical protein